MSRYTLPIIRLSVRCSKMKGECGDVGCGMWDGNGMWDVMHDLY